MLNSSPIPLTQHACARMRENGLTRDKVLNLWKVAKEITVPPNRLMYKFLKYGVESLHTIKYFKASDYLFTIGLRDPSNPVIVTITKQS